MKITERLKSKDGANKDDDADELIEENEPEKVEEKKKVGGLSRSIFRLLVIYQRNLSGTRAEHATSIGDEQTRTQIHHHRLYCQVSKN